VQSETPHSIRPAGRTAEKRNMSKIPDYEIESLARLLLPDIEAFYKNGGREALERAKETLTEQSAQEQTE